MLALAVAAETLAAPPSAAVLVQNELAFAQAAVDRGTRAAFLEVLADSSVVMQPVATPGRASIENSRAPGAKLLWRPDLASISAGGDFGWASGPFNYFGYSTGAHPEDTGHYVTVWRLEAGGAWRVLLDGGVSYSIGSSDPVAHLAVTARLRKTQTGHAAPDCSGEFAARWQSKDRVHALKDYLADDARLLYSGAPPRDGRGIDPKADPLAVTPLRAVTVAHRLTAEGGDLMVDYGEYALDASGELPARRLLFIRAWDLGHGCRLALEALNPAS